MKLRHLASRWAFIVYCLLRCTQAGASGHFEVDDTGTLDAGRCGVEAWAGRLWPREAGSFQHLGGACALGPVELGLNTDRATGPGRPATLNVGPQIKWNFWGREADAVWSAAAVVGASFDARQGGRPGGQFVLPLGWRASDRFNLLVNAGADWSTGSGAATVRKGAALEWACSDRLTLIVERSRAVAQWTSRLGARIAVAPGTTVEVSAARIGPVGDGRLRSVVIGLNQEFGRP